MSISTTTIQKFRDQWLAAGLDPAIAAVATEAIDRSAALGAERQSTEADARQQRNDIVTALASGEISLTDAVQRDLSLSAAGAAKTSADGLKRAAQQQAANLAADKLKAIGDRLITEHLDPAYQTGIVNIVKLADKLDGVTSDADAARAPKPQREAWSTLLQAMGQLHHLERIARDLRANGIVPDSRRAHPEDFRFRHPERLPAQLPRRATTNKRPAHELLIEAVNAGAEPAILTADVAEARLRTNPRPQPQSRIKVERDGTTIVDGVRPGFVETRPPSTIAPMPSEPHTWPAA